MLGDLIASLDYPDVAAVALTTMTRSLPPGSSDAPLQLR
jgi:hypothetical protein